VVLHAGGGSFKSQMRKADASGAQVALIIGEDELKAATVTVKPLREAREQQRVPRAGLAGRLADILKGT
jgi:histidyl-tRNA synthetase